MQNGAVETSARGLMAEAAGAAASPWFRRFLSFLVRRVEGNEVSGAPPYTARGPRALPVAVKSF